MSYDNCNALNTCWYTRRYKCVHGVTALRCLKPSAQMYYHLFIWRYFDTMCKSKMLNVYSNVSKYSKALPKRYWKCIHLIMVSMHNKAPNMIRYSFQTNSSMVQDTTERRWLLGTRWGWKNYAYLLKLWQRTSAENQAQQNVSDAKYRQTSNII